MPMENNGNSYGNKSFSKRQSDSNESLSCDSSDDSGSSFFESNFSSDDESSSMPAPPDGGYGWMIVFSAFMINLISDGVSFSFGILYTELLNYFVESKSLTSWVGSLFYGTCLIGGPLASALATKFGCRKVLAVGGLVASFGTYISAYTDSIAMLCVTFGVITGLGMSMGYVTSVVMVAFYFESKRALATGLSVCGSGIGTFLFAPLTEYLINKYGWRGTMMIWSGIILNLVVCACLLRPLEFTAQERRLRALQKFERLFKSISATRVSSSGKNVSRHTSDGCSDSDSSFDVDCLDQCHSQIQIPTFIREKGVHIPVEVLKEAKKNKEILKDFLKDLEEKGNADEPNADIMKLQNVTSHEQVATENQSNSKPKSSCLKKSATAQNKELFQRKQVRMSTYLPLYRKGLFFRGNLARVNGCAAKVHSTSCPELTGVSYDDSDSDSDSSDDSEWIWKYLHFSKHMKRVLKTMFDPSILKHPLYLLFASSNFILYFWYDVPYIFIADRAIEHGMEESNASFLLSVIGIVNTLGQILYGIVGDMTCVNLSVLYGASSIACGFSVFFVPWFTDFLPLSILSGFFGLFISVNYALSTVILVEFLGLDKLSNAYGLTMLVQGVANLLGPPVAAAFYDGTRSYDVTFFLGGGFIIMSGILLLCVPVCRKCKYHLKLEEQTRSFTVYNSSFKTNLDLTDPVEDGHETQRSSLLVGGGGANETML